MSKANGKNGKGKHKKSTGRDNLILWKPGQSGNPKGRAPGLSIKQLMDAELAKQIGDTGITKGQAVVMKLLEMAIKGDTQATKLILDRVYPAALNVSITQGRTPEELHAMLDVIEVTAIKCVGNGVQKKN